jgi:hypothetical protein
VNAAEIVLACVLGAWLLASWVAQPRPSPVLRTRLYDIFSLLPNYRFFAPKPIAADYMLLWRSPLSTDTSWMTFIALEKRWWCFAWNPNHRVRKAICDSTTLLLRERRIRPDWIHLSYSYLLMLNAVSALAEAQSFTSVQFAIRRSTRSDGGRETLIFVSHVHLIHRPISAQSSTMKLLP